MVTMDGSAIPEQHDRSPEVPQKVLQKMLDIPMIEIARVELHVEGNASLPGRDAESPNGRDSVLLEPVVEERCLASGCPCASYVGDEQETAFIKEYQMGATFCGFFLCEASRNAPSVQWLPRPSALRGVRVFDNSTQVVPKAAKRDWHDTGYESVSK